MSSDGLLQEVQPYIGIFKCEWIIYIFEKIYLFYFLYTDYRTKVQKRNIKILKEIQNNKDESGISSSNELFVRTFDQAKRYSGKSFEIDSQSDEGQGSSGSASSRFRIGSESSGGGGSSQSTSTSSYNLRRRLYHTQNHNHLKQQQTRGLKSHLALNELKLKIKKINESKLRN